MRILMVNLWKMINSAGGAEKVFCEMANMLSERGHCVTSIAFDKNKGMPFYPVNENVKFINSGQGCKLGKNWWQKIRASFYSKDEKELYSEKIYDDIRSKRLAPFVNEKDFDVIISYNPSATRILINKLKVKIVVIPNIVPQYSNSDCHKEKCIVNVARIDGQTKRQILLIEAFNKIKTKYPDWKLEFWGDIDYDKKYYKKCQNMISRHKLSEQVFFGGGAQGKFLSLYKKGSIFIKDGENGYLCEDGVNAFAQALDKLMSDEKLRKKMGKAAKEDMKQYDSEKIWDMWEKLIKQVAQGNLSNH